MKILLINPPFLPEEGKFSREQRSPAITKSGTFYYPMWIAYATGVLEKAGYKCMLIDAPAKQKRYSDIMNDIENFKPDFCIVDTSTPSIKNDVDFAVVLKEKFNCPIVLVGTHPSALPEEVLKMNEKLDFVARKEYEYTIKELSDIISNDKSPSLESLKRIDGISFRFNGEIYHNKDREFVTDLDLIPFVSKVYKKHLDHKDYFYSHSKYPIVVTVTGRGCPFQCVYCVYPQVFNGHRLRYRSIENVVDEIEYIVNNFEVKSIMFEDDTLTVNKERAIAFAKEIIKRNIKIEWDANSRADVDLETMKWLKKAGARLFCVGIESGDQTILDNMKKSITVDKIRQFFKNSKKAGIKVHGCFLVGNPGETKDTLDKTLKLAKELNPDTAQFFPIMVYPGTKAYEWAMENDFLKEKDFNKWLTPDGLHNCVVSRPGLSDVDLVEFCDRARKEFYLRPYYIGKKLLQGMTDLYEFKRLIKGGLTLSRYIFRGTFSRKEKC
jgi:radical SAM superfamily enzyme YgiQ (UPF0313 family)